MLSDEKILEIAEQANIIEHGEFFGEPCYLALKHGLINLVREAIKAYEAEYQLPVNK